MQRSPSFVTMMSGNQVTVYDGAPRIEDMAVCLGRICRWTGNLQRFWSVLLHSFVVCDLVKEARLKAACLLHDGTDSVTNDTPSPLKTPEQRAVEQYMTQRTHVACGIPLLTEIDHRIIKVADIKATGAEAWVLGYPGQQDSYPDRDEHAETLVRMYLSRFSLEDQCENGVCALEFLRRWKNYKDVAA